MIWHGKLPLTHAYGERAAGVLGYTNAIGFSVRSNFTRAWTKPGATIAKSDLYYPEVMATENMLLMSTSASAINLYLIDDYNVTCLARGFPWNPDIISAIINVWSDLPYSALVCSVLVDKLEWMDANPGYRGIPVRQSKTEERKLGARDA